MLQGEDMRDRNSQSRVRAPLELEGALTTARAEGLPTSVMEKDSHTSRVIQLSAHVQGWAGEGAAIAFLPEGHPRRNKSVPSS